MQDRSNLLWGDLQTDRERAEFIQSGLAVETGILAQAMVEDLTEVYRRIDALQQQVRDAVGRLEVLDRVNFYDDANYVWNAIAVTQILLKKAVGNA